ncbi:4'-phosphopantetheinyl transferase family protein [Streptomyces sp. cmx-4-9]|uniref:4'-phosphopantetheinyl transferase family protein n=1 Tax=Streptomyces sp. cmx-4-9 TaxID=2790941 RepID=UPI0039807F44
MSFDLLPARGGGTALAVVAGTAEVLARPELDASLLEPWEHERLARIRVPSRRDDVLAARLLLRLCLARFTGGPLRTQAPAQSCATCGRSGHGRPFLPGRPEVGISMSHADGLAAAAVGPGPVGIDVEPAARRPGPLPVLRRMLPGAETELAQAAALPEPGPALLRVWVRHEARLKAGGGAGLRVLTWTDRGRAAVAAVASAAPAAVAPALSPSLTGARAGAAAGGRG